MTTSTDWQWAPLNPNQVDPTPSQPLWFQPQDGQPLFALIALQQEISEVSEVDPREAIIDVDA